MFYLINMCMQLKCQTQTMYVISENSSAFPISHASNRPLLLLHIERAKNETTPFDMAINLFQHICIFLKIEILMMKLWNFMMLDLTDDFLHQQRFSLQCHNRQNICVVVVVVNCLLTRIIVLIFIWIVN